MHTWADVSRRAIRALVIKFMRDGFSVSPALPGGNFKGHTCRPASKICLGENHRRCLLQMPILHDRDLWNPLLSVVCSAADQGEMQTMPSYRRVCSNLHLGSVLTQKLRILLSLWSHERLCCLTKAPGELRAPHFHNSFWQGAMRHQQRRLQTRPTPCCRALSHSINYGRQSLLSTGFSLNDFVSSLRCRNVLGPKGTFPPRLKACMVQDLIRRLVLRCRNGQFLSLRNDC